MTEILFSKLVVISCSV